MQTYGGISRYFSDLIVNTQISNNVKVILPFKFHNNSYLAKSGIGITNKFINRMKLQYLNKFIYLNRNI